MHWVDLHLRFLHFNNLKKSRTLCYSSMQCRIHANTLCFIKFCLPSRIAPQSKTKENTFDFTFSRTRLFSSAASICGKPDKRNIFYLKTKKHDQSLICHFSIFSVKYSYNLLHTFYYLANYLEFLQLDFKHNFVFWRAIDFVPANCSEVSKLQYWKCQFKAIRACTSFHWILFSTW